MSQKYEYAQTYTVESDGLTLHSPSTAINIDSGLLNINGTNDTNGVNVNCDIAFKGHLYGDLNNAATIRFGDPVAFEAGISGNTIFSNSVTVNGAITTNSATVNGAITTNSATVIGTLAVNNGWQMYDSVNGQSTNPYVLDLNSGALGSHTLVFRLAFYRLNRVCYWNIWAVSPTTVWPVTASSNVILLTGQGFPVTNIAPTFGNTAMTGIVVENGVNIVVQLIIQTDGNVSFKKLDGSNFVTSVQFPNQFSGSYRIVL